MSKVKSTVFWTAVFNRFFRAFVAGALTGVSIITVSDVTTWTDLGTTINAMLVSAVIGGINGVIMALDKAVRCK